MVSGGEILPRLVTSYLELADRCYRVSVTVHNPKNGRFQRGSRGPRVHPALLKKADLDAALMRVYERFFRVADEPSEAISTSTSNSLPQGSETFTSPASSELAASRSEQIR